MAKNKTAFSENFLSDIKKLLTQEKERLEKELAKFTKKNPNVDDDYDSTFPDYGDKEDENAAEVAQYAANLPLEESLEKTIQWYIQNKNKKWLK